MATPPADLQSLPLDLIHLILRPMTQEDVGNLRLASRALSAIGIQYMLRTFPMRLSFDGLSRVLALTENLALSRHVRTLTFSTSCEDQRKPANSRDIDGLTAKHQAVVAQLGRRYVSTESDIVYREQLREKKSSERKWPECRLRYLSKDLGPVMGEKHLGFKPWYNHCGDPALVIQALHAFIVRFPALRRIYMEQDGWIFDWQLHGTVRVHQIYEPLPDWVPQRRRWLRSSIGHPPGPPDPPPPTAGCWTRTMEDVAWFFEHFHPPPTRRTHDSLTFFILSNGSYIRFWPVAPRFERLELHLPSLAEFPFWNMAYYPKGHGFCFRASLGTVPASVKSLCVRWSYARSRPEWPRVAMAITPQDAEGLAWFSHQQIVTSDMKNLEEIDVRFPYGHHTHDDAVRRRNGYLIPFRAFYPPRMRKLDLGVFATTEGKLNGALAPTRGFLRDLRLTTVDMTEGSWLGWFANIRRYVDQLENADFCDALSESTRGCSLRMEVVISKDHYPASTPGTERNVEGKVIGTSFGSALGEICVSRTSLDCTMREAVLGLLEKNMRRWEA